MNLGDINNKDLSKDLLSNNALPNFVNDFIKELTDYLQNDNQRVIDNRTINEKIQNYNNEREIIKNTLELKENKIYVISDIKDYSINVVDIENGDEITIYISTNDEITKKLNAEGITDKIYEMNKMDFFRLNLTDNVITKENKLYFNSNKIEIKNDLAWRILSDLYIQESETEGKQYKVANIKENKVYLTNADGSGGYFSIHKELYPDFKVGDIVIKNNREYKIQSEIK